MIIVHQMAKVASMAWVEAARPAAQTMNETPLHTHFLSDANLQVLAATLASPASENTIVNPLIVRSMLRNGKRALAKISAARAAGREIRVITGMRDPVARSISLLSFFADFCGHTDRSLSARDGAGPDEVCAALRSLWRAVLSGTAPDRSFERLLWHMIGAYRTWFSLELQPVFNLDVLATPFPFGGVQCLRSDDLKVLVYRAEDLLPDAPAQRELHAAARMFFSTPDLTLLEVNTAATRRSYPLYKETRNRFKLPSAMLDEIYEVPVVRHFYSHDEISAFKTRWKSARRTDEGFI